MQGLVGDDAYLMLSSISACIVSAFGFRCKITGTPTSVGTKTLKHQDLDESLTLNEVFILKLSRENGHIINLCNIAIFTIPCFLRNKSKIA